MDLELDVFIFLNVYQFSFSLLSLYYVILFYLNLSYCYEVAYILFIMLLFLLVTRQSKYGYGTCWEQI